MRRALLQQPLAAGRHLLSLGVPRSPACVTVVGRNLHDDNLERDLAAAHALLGTDRSSSMAELQDKFNEAALRLHPDHNVAAREDSEEFVRLREAHDMVRPLARQAGGVISFTEVDYHHDDIRDEKGRIAAFRRTIPILFCHGPWHSSWAWDSTQQRLASAGFVSRAAVTSGVDALGSVDEEVRALLHLCADRLNTDGPWHNPPVLVAHGAGSFVAQRFAELHPVTGLVLIAPFGPAPREAVAKLREAAQSTETFLPDIADSTKFIADEPDPTALLLDMAEQELVIEPDMYDVLLVTSRTTDPVVSSDDVEEVDEWYGNACDELEFEGGCGSSHFYFLDPEWDEEGGTSEQIVEWIDENYN